MQLLLLLSIHLSLLDPEKKGDYFGESVQHLCVINEEKFRETLRFLKAAADTSSPVAQELL